MGFVNQHQGIVGDVLEECRGGFTGRSAREVPGVVLYALAVTQLTNHFDVISRALLKSLGLEQLFMLFELLDPIVQLRLDQIDAPNMVSREAT